MIIEKGSIRILFCEFLVCLSVFELLTFEFKEMIEHKRIEGLYKIFFMGHFHQVQEAHAGVCTCMHILASQRMTCGLISHCETTVISRTQH